MPSIIFCWVFSGKGANALLLIDEAQNLSRTVLEQIRMLSNLETEKDKLIQIVLVGQSELKEVLSAHSLRQLDDRITVRYHLKPLDQKDARGYVEHRLVVAGERGMCVSPMGPSSGSTPIPGETPGVSMRSATGPSSWPISLKRELFPGK